MMGCICSVSAGQRKRISRIITQLRKSAHDEMERVIQQRRDENRMKPTQEDQDLGIYIENIEPQVRDAVIQMRQKGYSTYESGFYNVLGEQRVSCEQPDFDGIVFSPELMERLAKNGIALEVEQHSIAFTPRGRFGIEDLKKIWDLIADELPMRGKPAAPSSLRQLPDEFL